MGKDKGAVVCEEIKRVLTTYVEFIQFLKEKKYICRALFDQYSYYQRKDEKQNQPVMAEIQELLKNIVPLVENENLKGLHIWVFVADSSDRCLSCGFEVEGLQQLLCANFSLTVGWSTVDVVPMERLVKHQDRNVAHTAQVDKIGVGQIKGPAQNVSYHILTDSNYVDQKYCNKKVKNVVNWALHVLSDESRRTLGPVFNPKTFHD